jgi:hypothetical protein
MADGLMNEIAGDITRYGPGSALSPQNEWMEPAAEAGNKMCLDCLYCKVSAKSTGGKRWCYCGKAKKEARHRELYWRMKKTCGNFEDMR